MFALSLAVLASFFVPLDFILLGEFPRFALALLASLSVLLFVGQVFSRFASSLGVLASIFVDLLLGQAFSRFAIALTFLASLFVTRDFVPKSASFSYHFACCALSVRHLA
jgi:hypothetical protein